MFSFKYSSQRNPLTKDLSVFKFSNLDLSLKTKNPAIPHVVEGSFTNLLYSSNLHLHLNVLESPTIKWFLWVTSHISKVGSFSKNKSAHVTIDFLGVKQDYSPDFYSRVIYKIAKKANVEVLNIAEHKFKPHGFTCVALLAESHMSFHTFPEKGIISFDFFTCAKISPTAALDILKKEIKHERAVVRNFDRSNKGVYEDLYSTPGHKKYYIVDDVLENFISKVGQHIEILKLEEFGNALFIDSELQVAEKDEKKYSGQFVNSALSLSKDNSSAAIIGGGDGGVVETINLL